MKFHKPQFWDKKISFLSLILYPLSLITIFIFKLKKILIKQQKFKLPIICVGNIYLGGTGKTPLSILLSKELNKFGKKPGIVRKFYQSHKDEYLLIEKYSNNLILRKNRITGILEAEKKFDAIILDDGFQDFKIKKDLNILCFNQKQLIGNGLIIPAGPLRENLNSVKNASIIVINGKKHENFENKLLNFNKNLKFFYSNYKPLNLNGFQNEKLLVYAGIGNPNNFFDLLTKNNLKIQKKFVFPDHHELSEEELLKILEIAEKHKLKILTTEKDFLKLKHDFKHKVNFLKVELEIENKNVLLNEILKIYDKKN